MIDMDLKREKLKSVDDEKFLTLLGRATPKELQFKSIGLGNSRNWASGERILTEHVLWFFQRTGVEGTVEGEAARVHVPGGSFHWLCPGVRHHFRQSQAGSVLRNFSVRFEFRHPDGLVTPVWRRKLLREFPEGRVWMEEMYLAHGTRAPHLFEKLRALLVLLWIDLWEASAPHTPAPAAPASFTRFEKNRLLQHVDAHLDRRFLQAELAGLMRLSPDYFARKFHVTFGTSPREWLTHRRLQRAASLLLESLLGIGEIAVATGYDDPRFFARQFRKHYGMRPSDYRARR